MDWTRTIDEILAVNTDGEDVVFVTRAARTFRILAENATNIIGLMNKPVRLLHMGSRCEFIFELTDR